MCEKNPRIRLGRVARRFHGGGTPHRNHFVQTTLWTAYLCSPTSNWTMVNDGLVSSLNALGERQPIGPGLLVTYCQSCPNRRLRKRSSSLTDQLPIKTCDTPDSIMIHWVPIDDKRIYGGAKVYIIKKLRNCCYTRAKRRGSTRSLLHQRKNEPAIIVVPVNRIVPT